MNRRIHAAGVAATAVGGILAAAFLQASVAIARADDAGFTIGGLSFEDPVALPGLFGGEPVPGYEGPSFQRFSTRRCCPSAATTRARHSPDGIPAVHGRRQHQHHAPGRSKPRSTTKTCWVSTPRAVHGRQQRSRLGAERQSSGCIANGRHRLQHHQPRFGLCVRMSTKPSRTPTGRPRPASPTPW